MGALESAEVAVEEGGAPGVVDLAIRAGAGVGEGDAVFGDEDGLVITLVARNLGAW